MEQPLPKFDLYRFDPAQLGNCLVIKKKTKERVDHSSLELRQVAQLGRVDPGDPVEGEVEGDQGGEGGGQPQLRESISRQIQDLDNFETFSGVSEQIQILSGYIIFL